MRVSCARNADRNMKSRAGGARRLKSAPILIEGTITRSKAVRIIQKLLVVKNPVVIINSSGGRFGAAFAIARIIRKKRGTTISILSESMATLILASGCRRYVKRNSVVMVHPLYGRNKSEVARCQKLYNKWMRRCTGKSFSVSREESMSHAGAIRRGFADFVL